MKSEREQKLIASLQLSHKLSLEDVKTQLGVSESTVRRLFEKLERDGVAVRTHGGIQYLSHGMVPYSFEHGEKSNIAQKTAIAREACQLLADGDIIFCDSGTTIQCFCGQLIEYLRQKQIHIQVYTNSLANLDLLSPHMDVTLLGGKYRPNRKDFCGYLTEQSLAGLYFSKSFVGADGCSADNCFTTTDFETAKMNQLAIKHSMQSILLADSSKFTVEAHVECVPATALYSVITDAALRDDVRVRLEKTNVKLICTQVQP